MNSSTAPTLLARVPPFPTPSRATTLPAPPSPKGDLQVPRKVQANPRPVVIPSRGRLCSVEHVLRQPLRLQHFVGGPGPFAVERVVLSAAWTQRLARSVQSQSLLPLGLAFFAGAGALTLADFEQLSLNLVALSLCGLAGVTFGLEAWARWNFFSQARERNAAIPGIDAANRAWTELLERSVMLTDKNGSNDFFRYGVAYWGKMRGNDGRALEFRNRLKETDRTSPQYYLALRRLSQIVFEAKPVSERDPYFTLFLRVTLREVKLASPYALPLLSVLNIDQVKRWHLRSSNQELIADILGLAERLPELRERPLLGELWGKYFDGEVARKKLGEWAA